MIKMDYENKKVSITVKLIFAICWFYYVKTHNIRNVEAHEVAKALGCYGYKNGCFVYSCKKCGDPPQQAAIGGRRGKHEGNISDGMYQFPGGRRPYRA